MSFKIKGKNFLSKWCSEALMLISEARSPRRSGSLLVIMALTSACLPGGGFYQKGSLPTESVSAIQASFEGEKAVATISASATVTQVIEAPPNSSLEGVKIAMQPGSLSIDMTVSLEEATSLSSGASASSFGITFDSEAGRAVNIENDAGVTEIPAESPPMQLQIPILPNTRLFAQQYSSLVVFFRQEAGAGGCEEEIFPPTQFEVQNSSIIIGVRKFGAYQALRVPTSELIERLEKSKDGRITMKRPDCQIITKTEIKSLPKASISPVKIEKNGRIARLSAEVKGDGISSCIAYGRDRVSKSELKKESEKAIFDFDFSSSRNAVSAKVSISCRLQSGLELDTGFSTFDLNPVTSFKFEAKYKNKGLELSSELKKEEIERCRVLAEGEVKGPWGSEKINDVLEIEDPSYHREEIGNPEGEITARLRMICETTGGLRLSSNLVTLEFSEAIRFNENAIMISSIDQMENKFRLDIDYETIYKLTGFNFSDSTEISISVESIDGSDAHKFDNLTSFEFQLDAPNFDSYYLASISFSNNQRDILLTADLSSERYTYEGSLSPLKIASFSASSQKQPSMEAFKLDLNIEDTESPLTISISSEAIKDWASINSNMTANVSLKGISPQAPEYSAEGLSINLTEDMEYQIQIPHSNIDPLLKAEGGFYLHSITFLEMNNETLHLESGENIDHYHINGSSAASNIPVAKFLTIPFPENRIQVIEAWVSADHGINNTTLKVTTDTWKIFSFAQVDLSSVTDIKASVILTDTDGDRHVISLGEPKQVSGTMTTEQLFYHSFEVMAEEIDPTMHYYVEQLNLTHGPQPGGMVSIVLDMASHKYLVNQSNSPFDISHVNESMINYTNQYPISIDITDDSGQASLEVRLYLMDLASNYAFDLNTGITANLTVSSYSSISEPITKSNITFAAEANYSGIYTADIVDANLDKNSDYYLSSITLTLGNDDQIQLETSDPSDTYYRINSLLSPFYVARAGIYHPINPAITAYVDGDTGSSIHIILDKDRITKETNFDFNTTPIEKADVTLSTLDGSQSLIEIKGISLSTPTETDSSANLLIGNIELSTTPITSDTFYVSSLLLYKENETTPSLTLNAVSDSDAEDFLRYRYASDQVTNMEVPIFDGPSDFNIELIDNTTLSTYDIEISTSPFSGQNCELHISAYQRLVISEEVFNREPTYFTVNATTDNFVSIEKTRFEGEVDIEFRMICTFEEALLRSNRIHVYETFNTDLSSALKSDFSEVSSPARLTMQIDLLKLALLTDLPIEILDQAGKISLSTSIDGQTFDSVIDPSMNLNSEIVTADFDISSLSSPINFSVNGISFYDYDDKKLFTLTPSTDESSYTIDGNPLNGILPIVRIGSLSAASL